MVRARTILMLVGLCVHPVAGRAQTPTATPVATERQYTGLTAEEAKAVIEKLEDAQRKLRAGEFQAFQLLAGANASSDQAKQSPRDAFLSVPFQKVWHVRRVPTDNRLWQPYQLAYAPNGLGQLYWDIEVVLGFNGNIERVLMTYKAPAPF